MEGKFLMQYPFVNYGFIQHERMEVQPLYLIDTGIERRDSTSYRYDNSRRPSYSGYVLQYTLKGCGHFCKEGTLHTLHAGSGFFSKIPENSSYYYDCSAHEPWEYFYLHFDGPAVESFYTTINELTGGVFHLPIESAPIRHYFRLIENYNRKGHLELYEGGEFLYRFLSGILRESETSTDNVSSSVAVATAYMREHFSAIGSITEISEICNISLEHLSRCFQKEKGQSPLQFLTKLRMEHALFLLLNTSDNIETIATACGYQNGNYFAKVFRKYMHCSPGEYRMRN